MEPNIFAWVWASGKVSIASGIGHQLIGHHLQQLHLADCYRARPGVDDAQRADDLATRSTERRAGIESNAVGTEEQIVGKPRIAQRILDDERLFNRHDMTA